MRNSDKRLVRHLLIAVLVKLVLLAGLWWLFIRDARVDVDAAAIASRLGGPVQTSGEKQ